MKQNCVIKSALYQKKLILLRGNLMELKTYIAKDIEATGSLTALAENRTARQALTAANAGNRAPPPVACGKLDDLIRLIVGMLSRPRKS